MKVIACYAAWLLAFILAAFGLSWSAVYSFWFSARFFQSVPAMRICDALASVVLLPVRVFFWLLGDIFDPSVPLTAPGLYAAINGVLLGVIAYASCRRWIFPTTPPAESAKETQSERPPPRS